MQALRSMDPCLTVGLDGGEPARADGLARGAGPLLRGQNRILRMVASGEPLSRVLDELIRFMEAQSGNALCSVLLVDASKTHLRWASAPSLPEAYNQDVDGLRIGAVSGSCGTAIHRRQPVIVSDIEHDPLWARARQLALSHGLKACTSTPILDGEGEPLGTFAFYYREARAPGSRDLALLEISRDLAGIAIERSRSTARIEEALRARDNFLTVASHELKTPIATLLLQITSLERLQRAAGSMPLKEIAPKLGNLERQGKKLLKLVEQLLDATQLLSGRLELERAPVDLAQTVRDVVGRLLEGIADVAPEVEIRADGPVICEGDGFRIEQVVVNLLSNAWKFGRGAPVEISVDRCDSAARLVVRDRGIGIAPADHARIFQQFERAVSVRNYGGLGLGLWLTRQLVERMRGRISVQSELDAGSTFTVELPLPP
ncbi:GAF domain-containing sensor histidine kinase [Sorangium sp. So ce260]|uniref:sensor histidine kinase n=1 Tax=Sorangium sp. So ce260 TaxID=3133291 RepID=UPI003F6238BD